MLDIKLFFSWQSDADTENLNNTEFLWTAIQESVNEVNEQLASNDMRIIAEQANTGEGGDYDIYKSIYEKIDNCDIFIVDMTVSYKRISDFEMEDDKNEKRRAKMAPNPNAYGEYHRAFARKDMSSKCRILVANSHYGNPQEDPMLIPFDTRQNNFTIVYDFNSNLQADKDDVLKELKEKLKRSLLDAANDIKESPKTKFAPFKWWTDVKVETPNFVSTTSTKNIAKKIVDNKQVLVIYGEKGLGKTRIVKESLKNKEIPFFYLDYYRDGGGYIVHQIVREIGERRPDTYIVVDRCDTLLLKHILDEGEQGLSNPVCVIVDEDVTAWKMSHRLIEEIPWNGDETLVRKLLLSIKEQLGDEKYNEACVECRNNLSRAVDILNNLAPQTIQEEKVVETYEDVNITTKDRETITNAMAIFSQIGYTLGAESDWQYFLSLPIISKELSNERKAVLYKQIVDWQFVSGSMQYSGRNIRCADPEEAIRRASDYVNSISVEEFSNIIKLCLVPQCPINLFDAFCRQSAEMVYSKNYTDKVVAVLNGTMTFVDFSSISNTRGAKLIYTFTKICPKAAADCLYRCFGTASDEDIVAFTEGRQDIVFALSMLSFSGDTFEKGATMLMRMAANENDFTISNNSKGCFLDLFPCFLPQTEVSLEKRLTFLDEVRGNQKYRNLLLKATKRMLQTRDFVRMGGPEKVGGKVLESYQSHSSEELLSYRKWALQLVFEELESNVDNNKDAMEALCVALVTLRPFGKNETLLDDLHSCITRHPEYDWTCVKKQLRLLIKRLDNKLLEEDADKVNNILSKLENDSILSIFNDVERLFTKSLGTQSFDDAQKEEAQIYNDLAKRFANEYDADILKELYASQATYYAFGETLAKIMSSEQRALVVKDSIRILSDDQNLRPWLFVEFITSCPEEERLSIREQLLKGPLKNLLFPLSAIEKGVCEQIDFLINCIREHSVDVTKFIWFWQRVRFSEMSKDLVLHFLNGLYSLKNADAYFAAIDVLAMLGLSQGTLKESEIADFVKKWTIEEITSLDMWIRNDDFWLVMERVIDGTGNKDLVQHLNQLMLSYVRDYKGYFSEPYSFRRMYAIFEEQYFSIIWPEISKYIVLPNDQFMTFYRIKSLLGAMIGGVYNSIGLLFAHSHIEEMMQLCETYPQLAPERLLLMTPAFEGDKFHPLVVMILEKYYSQPNVKSALMDNLGTYSIVGSALPLLEKEKNCFEKLRDEMQDERLKEWCNEMIVEMNQRIAAENVMETERFERFGI